MEYSVAVWMKPGDEPQPHFGGSAGDIPVIQAGGEGLYLGQLPPDDLAAWCRRFASRLEEFAIEVDARNAQELAS